jgi:ribonuclease BN (tRNA processing enzyme)
VSSVSLLCLGTASALSDGRSWNSILLDGRILLDLPPTATIELRRHGIDPAALDVVFISHLHADHAFGLPFLLLEYTLRSAREVPVVLVGPPGLREHSERLFDLAWPGLDVASIVPKRRVEYVELEPRREVRVADLAVSAIPMKHFGLAAYGYRFTCRGTTFAYTGDTGDCCEIDELVTGADVAIIELTHTTPKKDPGHLDIARVARLVDALRARGTRVFTTHMSAPPARTPLGVTACEDGKAYWVP